MMWSYYDGWNWFWMIPMMLIFWGILIGLAVWLIRTFAGPRHRDEPLEILRRRFAAGEITQDEFNEKRKTLGS